LSPRPIRRVLVANRGEIAIRICRTLREMGIASVAIFSEADQDAAHLLAADEAYLVGPPPARQSYLDMDRVLDAAKRSGADAVHPGYGFLSESAEFAQRVIDAGLVWIGPTASAIRALGDKLSARALAIQAKVPVLPGTEKPTSDTAELKKAAERTGFPLALKAAAGGGGKGMRRVNAAGELEQALQLTQGEAKNAFGDDRIYVERWLDRPRHIEVQLLGDSSGNVIALGERDCSIQRRHQKLVEETPSIALNESKRRELLELAVRIARAGGYTNAGTAEFLMDPEGNFYFLEVNSRLQVEHPVTELALGMDLVREQVRLASGEKLSMKQEEVRPRGAAIEFRISAEDSENGFLPQAGLIRLLELPQGPGVRCDFGVRSGGVVPIHYDPLIGKIIVWGESREQALGRAARALAECVISGIPTTLSFHRWLVAQPAFRSGRYDTAYLSQEFRGTARAEDARDQEDAAILAALYVATHPRGARFVSGGTVPESGAQEEAPSRWRAAGLSFRAPPRSR
jgi:acetyl-CoA carboxylase biotin carboxylase subunit